mgnify:CR=1 FL=1|jgi:hypothetical protein
METINTLQTARQARRNLTMISKIEDEKKLLKRQDEVKSVIPKIRERIVDIRNEGRSSSNVNHQKQLYFEGTELESLQSDINTRLEILDNKLKNLSEKQKEWFGLNEAVIQSAVGDKDIDTSRI